MDLSLVFIAFMILQDIVFNALLINIALTTSHHAVNLNRKPSYIKRLSLRHFNKLTAVLRQGIYPLVFFIAENGKAAADFRVGK